MIFLYGEYMKRIILLLIILLLCLPAVFAESSVTVKDGWVAYYSSFTHDKNTYDIRSVNAHHSDPDDALITIRKNGELVTQVPFAQCRTTAEYKYCFENMTLDSQLIDIDSKGNLQPALKVKLIEYGYTDGFTISRSFEKTKLYLNEEAEVTMTAKNTGDFPIFNITVIEPVPETFKISKYEDRLLKTGNKLKGTFTLYPGSEWSATYHIKSLNYNTTESYQTDVTYWPENKDVEQIKQSEKKTISVVTPYTTSTKISSDSIDINGKIKYTVTIKNEEDSEITVKNIEIRVPSTLATIEQQGGLRKEEPFVYIDTDKIIEVGESAVYSIEGKIAFAGSYEFVHAGTVSTKGYPYELSDSKSFEVQTEGISCSVLTNPSIIHAGEEYEYSVLVNNNDDEMFYEIQGKTNTNKEEYVENVPQKTKNTIIEVKEAAPLVFEKATKKIVFNGTYRTVNNQWFDLNCQKVFDVQPAQRILLIDVTVDKENAKRNETVQVGATIENVLSTPVNNVVLKSGALSRTISLAADEILAVEAFNVTIPELHEESTYSATLTVEIPSSDYLDMSSVDITVSNPYVSEGSSSNSPTDDSASNTNSSNDDETSLITKKEKSPENMGFFEKIKYLFSSIFG